jgi:hypothetical protein
MARKNIEVRAILLIVTLFFLNSCATVPRQPLTPDQIISQETYYTVTKSRDLAIKYRYVFEDLIVKIRADAPAGELEFFRPKEGKNLGILIGFDWNDVDRKELFLFVNVFTNTQYNTIKMRYMARAATNFNKYAPTLIKATCDAASIILKEDSMTGVGLTIGWVAKDFVNERHLNGTPESIALFIPKDAAISFVQGKITNQEMIRRSKIYGFQGTNKLGLIELKLDDAL